MNDNFWQILIAVLGGSGVWELIKFEAEKHRKKLSDEQKLMLGIAHDRIWYLGGAHYGHNLYQYAARGDAVKGYVDNATVASAQKATNDSDGSFTFFRDDKGKYTDGQVSGTKTYYTGFEDITGRTYPSWYDSSNSEQKNTINTVVFKDKIKPKTCYYWFARAYSLTSITGLDKLNTENVTSMNSMFYSCNNLTNLDVSSFNTENVTNMLSMFQNCNKLTSLDVNSFNTENVKYMLRMFSGCSKLKTIYASSLFTTNAVSSSDSMFINSVSLVGGAGTKYNANYVDKTYARIDGGTNNPVYFTAKVAPAKASLQR